MGGLCLDWAGLCGGRVSACNSSMRDGCNGAGCARGQRAPRGERRAAVEHERVLCAPWTIRRERREGWWVIPLLWQQLLGCSGRWVCTCNLLPVVIMTQSMHKKK